MNDGVFRFENPSDSENELTAVMLDSGVLMISVADEKAVDSYNSTFECDIRLPMENARLFRDWLIANVKG